MSRNGVIERYCDRLPLDRAAEPISLGEGSTPLLEASTLAAEIQFPGSLFLKVEGANPTGSFKDRGMTVAITAAAHAGARAVICASTGNTSASAAAYAARAGLDAFVIIPEGNVAAGKLSQAVAHGARVIAVDGSFDDAMAITTTLIAQSVGVIGVNSVNPLRLEGQKTAAFEICDELGQAPDYHTLPVGNAGNITAYWRGYSEYRADDVIASRPLMLGFQAEGSAPFVHGRQIDKPETVASAIRIGRPVNWETAVTARDESGGSFHSVTDDEILRAQHTLASTEGVFVEPASAAPIAGIASLSAAGFFLHEATMVCTLTGHGLKDPAAATRIAPTPSRVSAEIAAVRSAMGI